MKNYLKLSLLISVSVLIVSCGDAVIKKVEQTPVSLYCENKEPNTSITVGEALDNCSFIEDYEWKDAGEDEFRMLRVLIIEFDMDNDEMRELNTSEKGKIESLKAFFLFMDSKIGVGNNVHIQEMDLEVNGKTYPFFANPERLFIPIAEDKAFSVVQMFKESN